MAQALAATNLILRALSKDEFDSFAADIEAVQLHRAEILVEPDHEYSHVVFPDHAVASSLTLLRDGSTVEAASIGQEGMCGLSVFLGGPSPTQMIIQVSDGGWRMKAVDFRRHLVELPGLRQLMGLYANAYVGQVSQSAACNARHVAEERCARWLLATDDRTGRIGEFDLTQDFLANMLGVQRPTVTIAVGILQHAGFIRYRRGHVSIIDRVGLEAVSCECYSVAARRFGEVFATFPPRPEG